MKTRFPAGFTCGVAIALTSFAYAADSGPCRIEVVEKGTGWPVPLIMLTSTSNQTFVTDNAGVVALDGPQYMNRKTWFSVSGDGYEVGKDGFGNRGFSFVPKPGETKKVEVTRTIIAKCLGRLTGSGIFAESQKLGDHLDWAESGIVGQDTVYDTPYAGKLFWIWGDTDLFGYPLGFYNTAGGTSSLTPLTTFEPPIGLVYDYYHGDEGTPRGVAPHFDKGPIWLTAVTTLPDAQGKDHLVATYTKIINHLEAVETGLAEWQPDTSMFTEVKAVWKKDSSTPEPLHPGGHPSFWTDGSGHKWLYFGEGLPNMRCPATYEAWKDSSTWEAVDRPKTLHSASGEEVVVAAGSVAYQPYRKRWVTVFQQKFGKPSTFGELWYAEADSPSGPWGPCVKILTHEKYTFYNPVIHIELAPPDAKFLLFEGTYTAEFSGNDHKTPLYNYNQILYRVDLDDAGLADARGDAPAHN